MIRLAEQRIKQIVPEQPARFRGFADSFESVYRSIEGGDESPFLTDVWRRFNERLERSLLPSPPFDFLRDPTIQSTMFVDVRGPWLSEERRVLARELPRSLYLDVVREDHAGRPVLAAWRDLTSHNSIHHLFHFVSYERATGVDLATVGSVVEWGGGYGNQAKIFKRLNAAATYVIVDTPLLSTLQWCYLSTVLGPERVNLVGPDDSGVVPGLVNLVPLQRLDRVEIEAELFISTWGLSESTAAAQDFVESAQWFGAKRLLIGFQEEYRLEELSLDAPTRVGKLAQAAGASIRPVLEALPRNYYAFL